MDNINIHLINVLPSAVSTLLIFYFIVKAIDMVTGLLKAHKNKGTFKSSIMRKGLMNWVYEIVGIVFVITVDFLLGLNFYICSLTLTLYIYKECMSIRENLKELGVILPDIIDSKLDSFKEE